MSFLNVGTGIDLSIKELAESVADVMGFRGEIIWDKSKPDGTPKKQLDIRSLSQLGWNAQIPLQEGLVDTVADFRRQFDKRLLRTS